MQGQNAMHPIYGMNVEKTLSFFLRYALMSEKICVKCCVRKCEGYAQEKIARIDYRTNFILNIKKYGKWTLKFQSKQVKIIYIHFCYIYTSKNDQNDRARRK
jgi:hypothetical protein